MRGRSHADRNRHKLARAFSTYNIANKSQADIQKDFELGLKVETGKLEYVSDIIRAISIIDDLVNLERMTKEHAVQIKIDLAQKMSGFKVVPNE